MAVIRTPLSSLNAEHAHRNYQNVCFFVFSFQFHLSHVDKELLEREDRRESQQEILRRIAKDLPIYTRTMSGGGLFSLSSAHPDFCQDIIVSGSNSESVTVRSGSVTNNSHRQSHLFQSVFSLFTQCYRSVFLTSCLDTAIRYCDCCLLLKPDRCHHCSACEMYVFLLFQRHKTL